MRILYYHQHFATRSGSAGTRSYELARALVEAGHQVSVICGEHNRGQLELPRDPVWGGSRGNVDGIDVIALPLHYNNNQGVLKRSKVFLSFAFQGVAIALSEPHDLLFATSTPLTAGIPGVAKKLLRRPGRFVFEVRDLWPELPRAMGLTNPALLWGMSALEWLSYRCADRCIGLSPGIVRGIRRRAKPGLPLEMIPNGCDLDLFNPGQRAPLQVPGIAPGDFVAGFTGAHGVANGLDALLDCAQVLKTRGRQDIKLLFVGDGSEKARLQARAREQGLSACVFLPLTPKVELARITASLDVGLQILANIPAFYYGTSPNKFFDYLAAGIPVLTNYPGWIADLIQTHDVGVAAPPADPEALADALQQLAAQPEQRALWGRNARALAEQSFARETLARQFVEFLVETEQP